MIIDSWVTSCAAGFSHYRMSPPLVMKMKMMKTGVLILSTAAVKAQMMAKKKVLLWPWFSSRSESLSTSFLLEI